MNLPESIPNDDMSGGVVDVLLEPCDFNVSVVEEALHDEKSHFEFKIDKDKENTDINELADSQDFDHEDEVFEFCLKDGILYSIILEKRWL